MKGMVDWRVLKVDSNADWAKTSREIKLKWTAEKMGSAYTRAEGEKSEQRKEKAPLR